MIENDLLDRIRSDYIYVYIRLAVVSMSQPTRNQGIRFKDLQNQAGNTSGDAAALEVTAQAHLLYDPEQSLKAQHIDKTLPKSWAFSGNMLKISILI